MSTADENPADPGAGSADILREIHAAGTSLDRLATADVMDHPEVYRELHRRLHGAFEHADDATRPGRP